MEDRTVFLPSAAGSVRPGARLNGIYEIERLIAQGGMGEVYQGFNIQTRHQVAIKMIRPEYSNDQQILDLFRREALILHNLTHEAIVRYFVFSVDPDLGRAYLAMEFVDGPSLTSRLSSGPLPLEEVKILQKRLASALETAHQHGVIHRDISPDNIILPGGDVRYAKIVDFGIARSVHPTEVSIIGSGFAGKYNFASPEQFGLAGGKVTFKSDIYSLGLVLAAALRGRPIDMSGAEMEAIGKRTVLPDLSDIDPAIRPLIQSMLQPLPANRPESMAAVASWEGGRRVGLRLPRASAATAKPAREGGSGRTAALLGVLIALVSIGGAIYFFRNDLARWSQSAGPSIPPAPAAAPPAGESRPTTTLPPLGPTATEPAGQAPAATEPSPASKPPEEAQPTTPPQQAQGDTAPTSPEVQTPSEAPNKPHVPSADELVAALAHRASHDAAAPPTPAAGPSPGALQPPVAAHPPATSPPVVSPDVASRLDAEPPAGSPSPPASSSQPSATSAPPATPPPAEASPADQKVARLSPDDRARAFIDTFDGGDCFFVDSLPAGPAHAYQAVGADLAPFRRFDDAYKREFGVEADLTVALITRDQCPALDLIRLGTDDREARPRIEQLSYTVSRGKPLTGTVANLSGRRLYLVLVDNEGMAYKLEAKPQPGGDEATFSIPLTPDANSAGSMQVLLALASPKPIPALDSLHQAALKPMIARLVDAARGASASVDGDYFRLSN